jgi:uncharacterized membrane protein YeaQ/YmgE (transglycosylase-associated protein family)
MAKLLGLIGLMLGGWIGWAMGATFSTIAAFFLSIVGSGVGLYIGRRLASDYF